MAKNKFITGLDIGSSTIKSLTVFPRPESLDFEVLSCLSEPCFGVRRGVVVDADKVSEVVTSLIGKSEQESGHKIEEVFINLGGGHIFSTDSRGTVAVSRADQKISEEDIERVIQAAQTFSLPPNREILEVFPKEFIVDGEKGIREAIGMEGVRLETVILVLGYFTPYFKNLTKAVLGAGLQIAHVIANPLASATAILTPREKELGVLLLDIGAGTSSFCAFKEGVLVTAGIVPIGSFHITKDIASGLQTDIDTAEKIKLQFGSCLIKSQKKIKTKESVSGEPLIFSSSQLGKIIDARVLEIIQQVQKELKKASCLKLPGGAVLAGGGAKLPKVKEFVKKNLKLACKMGSPKKLFPKQSDPQLACVAGLALKGGEFLKEEGSFASGFLEKINKGLRSFVR